MLDVFDAAIEWPAASARDLNWIIFVYLNDARGCRDNANRQDENLDRTCGLIRVGHQKILPTVRFKNQVLIAVLIQLVVARATMKFKSGREIRADVFKLLPKAPTSLPA